VISASADSFAGEGEDVVAAIRYAAHAGDGGSATAARCWIRVSRGRHGVLESQTVEVDRFVEQEHHRLRVTPTGTRRTTRTSRG
jgi:hypothetical protein